MKTMYVTKKQVNDFIKNHLKKGIEIEELKVAVNGTLDDLNKHPEANKNQIKFYSRVIAELNK